MCKRGDARSLPVLIARQISPALAGRAAPCRSQSAACHQPSQAGGPGVSLAWWSWRGCPTRSHSELGRETPQRPWYCASRHGRVGRRQANQTPGTEARDQISEATRQTQHIATMHPSRNPRPIARSRGALVRGPQAITRSTGAVSQGQRMRSAGSRRRSGEEQAPNSLGEAKAGSPTLGVWAWAAFPASFRSRRPAH